MGFLVKRIEEIRKDEPMVAPIPPREKNANEKSFEGLVGDHTKKIEDKYNDVRAILERKDDNVAAVLVNELYNASKEYERTLDSIIYKFKIRAGEL